MNTRFDKLARLYRAALLDDVIPFWERHSLDRECGGYFSCLDRDGSVYDTDKFTWLQARQVWTFSTLYNRLEKRREWLEIARHGADFLLEHAADGAGNWYFALTREGKPLVQPCNIFSDCFAAMAFGQYALASGDDEAKAVAERTFKNILRRQDNPKGKYSKAAPGTRPMRPLALPMILANLVLELEWMLDGAQVEQTIDDCIDHVMRVCLDEGRGLVFENVAPDGSHADSLDGRLICPGHSIEAMWFIMDLARRRGELFDPRGSKTLPAEDGMALAGKADDVVMSTRECGELFDPRATKHLPAQDGMDLPERRGELFDPRGSKTLPAEDGKALVEKAVDVVMSTLEFAWDKEHGGIFYFMDADGHPPDKLDWNRKLWWVHLETLVALLKGYASTGRAECWEWFERVHDYAWARFPDPERGEWFGYLSREGEVFLPLKGGKWKGCFHVPRALYVCSEELAAIARLRP